MKTVSALIHVLSAVSFKGGESHIQASRKEHEAATLVDATMTMIFTHELGRILCTSDCPGQLIQLLRVMCGKFQGSSASV